MKSSSAGGTYEDISGSFSWGDFEEGDMWGNKGIKALSILKPDHGLKYGWHAGMKGAFIKDNHLSLKINGLFTKEWMSGENIQPGHYKIKYIFDIYIIYMYYIIQLYKNYWIITMARELKDKSSKFVELAEKRVSRTLNDLKLIRNLSNKNYYEYSDEQSKKIIRVLQQELDLLKKSFQNLNSKEKGFKL